MKLYNIFEKVILDETARVKNLLKEDVSEDLLKYVIDNKLRVNITYSDYPNEPPSRRYIEIYNIAKTKANNDCVRAYQIFGGSKTTPRTGAWKIFRLDRIKSFQPTKMKWYNPQQGYQLDGTDRSMITVSYSVNLNDNSNNEIENQQI